MQKEITSGSQAYDFAGMFVSILCGIHCLVTPLLILSFPALDDRINSPWVHGLLIGFVAWSFYQSVFTHYKLHKSKKTLGFGVTGFLILVVVSAIEVFAHGHGEEHGGHHAGGAEAHHDESFVLYLAITGSILLVTSHILNIRECKCLNEGGTCKAEHNS